MQIACEARRAICKNPRDPKISDFRIPFELQGQRPKKRTNFKAQGLKGPYVPITGDEPKDGGEVGRWAQQVWKGRVMHGSIPVEETEDGQFEVTKGAKRGKVEPTPPRRTAMSELKEWEEKQQRQRDGEE